MTNSLLDSSMNDLEEFIFSGTKPNPDSVVSILANVTSVAVLGLGKIGETSLTAETLERLLAIGKNGLDQPGCMRHTGQSSCNNLGFNTSGGDMGINSERVEWLNNLK